MASVSPDLLPPSSWRPPPILLLLLLILITLESTTPSGFILLSFSEGLLSQPFSGTFHSLVIHDAHFWVFLSCYLSPLASFAGSSPSFLFPSLNVFQGSLFLPSPTLRDFIHFPSFYHSTIMQTTPKVSFLAQTLLSSKVTFPTSPVVFHPRLPADTTNYRFSKSSYSCCPSHRYKVPLLKFCSVTQT